MSVRSGPARAAETIPGPYPTGTSDARLWLCGHGRTWLGPDVSNRRKFHATLPGYQPTPLRSIPDLAERLGVGTLLVKDESRRFGLPSFKILGASWGVYQALCNLLDELPSKWSTLEELREYLAPVRDTCLLTATAGNHGRAVSSCAAMRNSIASSPYRATN